MSAGDIQEQVEELWTMLAELHDMVEAQGKTLASIRKHGIIAAQHVERLVHEKEQLLHALGILHVREKRLGDGSAP